MFKLFLVTPEQKIVTDQEIEEITLPGFSGQLNILPGHAPITTTLEPGILSYKLQGVDGRPRFAVSWGYCQVTPEGVSVLAETAATKEEIDLPVVKKHLVEQESKLTNEALDDSAWTNTQHEISRLKAEIEIKEQL
jgi:F-type H+-transporting ATPase subunit epsilon